MLKKMIKARQKKGLSQKQLGSLIFKPAKYIRDIEREKIVPSDYETTKLGAILNLIPREYWFEADKEIY